MIILHLDLQPQFKYMNYFIYTSHHFTPHGRHELKKLTSLPTCGFIAQLVEHRIGIRGGHGFESVEALIFFRLLLSNCLNWKIYCDDRSSLMCLFVAMCSSRHFNLVLGSAEKLPSCFGDFWNQTSCRSDSIGPLLLCKQATTSALLGYKPNPS